MLIYHNDDDDDNDDGNDNDDGDYDKEIIFRGILIKIIIYKEKNEV